MKTLQDNPAFTQIFDSNNSNTLLRVAIIGCGPRGLQCLEAISRRLSADQRRRLCITLFEPAEVLGAGAVYNPSQSHSLRMNFATQHIDFWKTTAGQKTIRKHSLLGWLSTRYPEYAKSDNYIPRAIVGEYLRDCFAEVRTRLADVASFAIVPAKVSDIRYQASQFVIQADHQTYQFDQVAITTGHEGLRGSRTSLTKTSPRSTPIPVLPADRYLTTESVPKNSRVLVQGFGLTAIDAVLALTDGRGGAFVGNGVLPRYVSSGHEPLRIDLRSRSGRPMLSKPAAKMEPISDTFWIPFRDHLKSLLPNKGRLSFHRDIWPVITDAAAKLLNQSGCDASARNVIDWFDGWSRYKMDPSTARKAMIQSYGVAKGKRPIDIPFALGDAWRRLYPELVQLISHGGLDANSWHGYVRTAREMERIAFGPPAENVGRLISLIRAGVVTIGLQQDIAADYDVTINAVIAGPHEQAINGPLRQLTKAGLVQVDVASGGVMVDYRGYSTGPISGLAVFGRATEGWVVGNDTLTRTLHTHIENWAGEIAVLAESRCT